MVIIKLALVFISFQECMLCGKRRALIRCVECFALDSLLCTACDDSVHTNYPLHDREVWMGTYFKAVSPTTSIDEETMELISIGQDLKYRCSNLLQ